MATRSWTRRGIGVLAAGLAVGMLSAAAPAMAETTTCFWPAGGCGAGFDYIAAGVTKNDAGTANKRYAYMQSPNGSAPVRLRVYKPDGTYDTGWMGAGSPGLVQWSYPGYPPNYLNTSRVQCMNPGPALNAYKCLFIRQ